MYLYSRRRQVNLAKGRAALGVAVEGAHRATEITGLDVRAWTAVFSPEFGTVMWSARIDDLEQLETASDKLNASTEFGDFIEQNDSCFSGPLQDSLSQVISGQPGAQVPEYITVVQARPSSGSLATAIPLAIEIAEAASRITGLPTMLASTVTGPYGGLAWITGSQDLKTSGEGEAKLMADPAWMPLLERASSAYLPDASTTILRRLA